MKKFKLFKVSHLVVLGLAMTISTLLGYLALSYNNYVLYFVFEIVHFVVSVIVAAYILLALYLLVVKR